MNTETTEKAGTILSVKETVKINDNMNLVAEGYSLHFRFLNNASQVAEPSAAILAQILCEQRKTNSLLKQLVDIGVRNQIQ